MKFFEASGSNKKLSEASGNDMKLFEDSESDKKLFEAYLKWQKNSYINISCVQYARERRDQNKNGKSKDIIYWHCQSWQKWPNQNLEGK